MPHRPANRACPQVGSPSGGRRPGRPTCGPVGVYTPEGAGPVIGTDPLRAVRPAAPALVGPRASAHPPGCLPVAAVAVVVVLQRDRLAGAGAEATGAGVVLGL